MERLTTLDERAIKTCTYSTGTAMLQVKMTDKRIEECVETILTGYRILAREYPNNVKIII
jgi:DNA-binding ferritin-like protein